MNNYIYKYNKYKNKYKKLRQFQKEYIGGSNNKILDEFTKIYPHFMFKQESCFTDSCDVSSCNLKLCKSKEYFSNLEKFINSSSINDVDFEMSSKEDISSLKMNCDYKSPLSCNDTDCSNNICHEDEYCIPNTIQILLGRFYDNVGCFYSCDCFFSLSYTSYSIFKNDLLLKYVLDNPKKFNITKEINQLFPIRILISDKSIPKHKLITTELINYTNNIIPKTKYAIENTLGKTNETKYGLYNDFFSYLSDLNEPGMITSRELCTLLQYNYYFYVVLDKKEDETTYKPFILVSKYNLEELQFMYNEKKLNMNLDNLVLLFHKQ
jgi:hypothetical protein